MGMGVGGMFTPPATRDGPPPAGMGMGAGAGGGNGPTTISIDTSVSGSPPLHGLAYGAMGMNSMNNCMPTNGPASPTHSAGSALSTLSTHAGSPAVPGHHVSHVGGLPADLDMDFGELARVNTSGLKYDQASGGNGQLGSPAPSDHSAHSQHSPPPLSALSMHGAGGSPGASYELVAGPGAGVGGGVGGAGGNGPRAVARAEKAARRQSYPGPRAPRGSISQGHVVGGPGAGEGLGMMGFEGGYAGGGGGGYVGAGMYGMML